MGKFINLTDQRFGFWKVICQEVKNKYGQTQWLCQCECGIQKIVTSNSLRTGNSTSCGCNHSPDLIGKKFGNLSVINTDYSKGRKYWMCQCDCGNAIITCTYKLKDKMITSCGCNINNEKNDKYHFIATNGYTGSKINPIYFNNINELHNIAAVKSNMDKKYFYRLSLLSDVSVSKLSVHVIYKLMAEFHNGYTYEYIGNLGIRKIHTINLWDNGLNKTPNIFKELNLPIFEDKWKNITHSNITPLAKILKPWGGAEAHPDLIQLLILKLQQQCISE